MSISFKEACPLSLLAIHQQSSACLGCLQPLAYYINNLNDIYSNNDLMRVFYLCLHIQGNTTFLD